VLIVRILLARRNPSLDPVSQPRDAVSPGAR
jgi:hypothetical protein